MDKRPLIGILMLETNFTRIKGDIGNSSTFSYPVRFKQVRNASPIKIVEEQDASLLDPFIEAAVELVNEGVKAITTSCGFLATFQQELAKVVSVPVFTSSLLQIPLVYNTLRPEQKVGVITANSTTLTKEHFAATDSLEVPKIIKGMENSELFYQVFVKETKALNIKKVADEMYNAAGQLMVSNPEVGAIVLECTNMPPFALNVKGASGVPVYDIVTLTNWVAESL